MAEERAQETRYQDLMARSHYLGAFKQTSGLDMSVPERNFHNRPRHGLLLTLCGRSDELMSGGRTRWKSLFAESTAQVGF